MGTKDAADPDGRPWYSGIFKDPVAGPVWLGETNLEGDRQADLRVHGGPNRAALCYSAGHYPRWAAEIPDIDWRHGMFGENFTITGLEETNVCIGDIYAVGDSRIQVSQLRGPCFKLERRIGLPGMIERVLATGRSGWYVRVLTAGIVQAGQQVILESREDDAPTLLTLHAATYAKRARE
jgi:MOSC domain-containing protein YiiM